MCELVKPHNIRGWGKMEERDVKNILGFINAVFVQN